MVAPELPNALKQLLHDGMREEYNHGVTAGINMCIGSLEKALEHPTVNTSGLKDGFDTAIYILKSILTDEELIHVSKEKSEEAIADAQAKRIAQG